MRVHNIMSTSLLHRSIISRAYHMHRANNSASTRASNLLLNISSKSHDDHQPSSSNQKSMNVGPRRIHTYHHRMISTTAMTLKSANDRMTLHTYHHRTISTTALKYKSAMPLSYDEEGTMSPSSSEETTKTNSTPFLLADIGEGISEVEVLQWFVKPGDTIAQFDKVCEVQSDKANVEITSRYDGAIESLCCNVGDMVYVGKPLLYIATAADESSNISASSSGGEAQEKQVAFEDDVQKDKPINPPIDLDTNLSLYKEMEQTTNEQQPFQEEREARKKVLTSPAVRKLCKEHNIDLGKVKATGPKGIVLKSDVLNIISMNSTEAATTSSSSKSTHEKTISSPMQLEEDTVIPIRGYNRLMVKNMTSSLQVPHMIYSEEINVNKLTEVRDSLRPLAMDHGVQKLTYLPFFIKASSLAMLKYPVLNSTIDADEMTLAYHAEHHIGVAVDTEKGLAVPVVKSCQNKSVLEIALELNRLYSLAIEGNLAEDDIANATFTLSNIGSIGGTVMSPVVLPPQVAIGAFGKIQRLPRFVGDTNEVEAARIMPVSWGGDHRAVDGATMARFSNLWKSYCESPSSMMFTMR